MPFFHIPAFPASGQRFAFVDREEQVRAIYDDLVSAGNEVRAGSADASLRLCVQGCSQHIARVPAGFARLEPAVL